MHNQNQQKKNKWNQLAENKVSQDICPVLVQNGKYFLFIGQSKDAHGIVMYDVQNDTYPESLKWPHPKYTNLSIPAIALDVEKNAVYLWGGDHHPCFMILDLNTKQWDTRVTINTTAEIIQKYNVIHVGFDCRAVFDVRHQTLHVIGGGKSNKHFIFNAKKQIFQEQYAFLQFKRVRGFGLVCDLKNNRLILFGGRIAVSSYSDIIFFFNLSSNSWTECKAFQMEIPLAHFGFVFFDKIQIALLFGGRSNGTNLDAIWMLDFNNNSCSKIMDIKCPRKGYFHAVLAPDPNSKIDNLHLFHSSKSQWCINIESLLPLEYYQLYCKSKTNSDLESNNVSVSMSMQEKFQLEMKAEQERMNAVVEQEKRLNQSMRKMIENQKRDIIVKEAIIQQNRDELEMQAALFNEEKEKIEQLKFEIKDKDQQIKQMNDLNSIMKNTLADMEAEKLKNELEIKENDKQGNFNLKHMNVKGLSMREKSFKSYFYSIVVKSSDKYYQSFISNEYNDLEIMIQFARVEDKNESLDILCNDCGMNKMHARQLLGRLSQLSKSNKEFEKWFEIHHMSKYYQKMLDAGVATFAMFENIFVCCTDLVQFIGENEEKGIFIWENLPIEKNKNESKSGKNQNTVSRANTSNANENYGGNDEGYEGEK